MSALTINRRRMNNVMLRPQAVRTWNQPDYADRGEPMHISGITLKRAAQKGLYYKDTDGKKIRNVSEYADADPVDVLFPEWGSMGLFFEDDICYAYLGIETNRPSAANGGYELHIKKHTPDHGAWTNLFWATTYVPFRPYRATTESYRIIDIHEVNGACTVTLIDPADGNRETITATMLTDTDDVENRPKTESVNAASVLFLAPVLPVSMRTVCGSLSAIRRNEFKGDKNAKANSGNMTHWGAMRYSISYAYSSASGSPVRQKP